MDQMLQESLYINGIMYSIYGDATYRRRPWMKIGFEPRTASVQELRTTQE